MRRVYCEHELPDGRLNPAVPRTACRKALEELRSFEGRGLRLLSAAEYEFCLATAATWAPAFEGPEIFVTLQGSKVDGFCYALEEQLYSVGIECLPLPTVTYRYLPLPTER